MPSLALQPATVPSDAPYSQALVNFLASYLRLSGLETLTGILTGIAPPGAADRDKAWLKLDPATSRPLGFFVYRGEWTQIPIIVPNGETEPVAPKSGELFFNTAIEALKLYNGSEWTTNFFHTGDTASRPQDVPVNYLYFDTTIGRLLRRAASDWTTLDGSIGDIKMVDYATEEAARENNPGWEVYSALFGRFPVGGGEDSDYAPQEEGDGTPLTWSAKGRSANGSSRDTDAAFITSLTLGDDTANADGRKMDGVVPLGGGTLRLVPKYKALIFLRKAI